MMDIGKYFDIYSFFGSPVGSPDIAAHLKKIGYEFSALELAWIVCQSTDVPLLLLEDYRPVNDDRCREYSSVFPIEAHCLSFGGRMLRTEDVEYLSLSFYRGEAFPTKG